MRDHLAWEFEKPFIISFITLRFIQPKINELFLSLFVSFFLFSFQFPFCFHFFHFLFLHVFCSSLFIQLFLFYLKQHVIIVDTNNKSVKQFTKGMCLFNSLYPPCHVNKTFLFVFVLLWQFCEKLRNRN